MLDPTTDLSLLECVFASLVSRGFGRRSRQDFGGTVQIYVRV